MLTISLLGPLFAALGGFITAILVNVFHIYL